METLKKLYINFLCVAIRKLKGIDLEPSIENILNNLDAFVIGNTDDANALTDPKSWLPVQYKRMLLFILYGNTVYVDTSYHWEENTCYAECCIRQVDDNKIICKATASALLEDTEPIADISSDKRRCMTENLASGSAETRALYRLGIGMQFVSDIYSDMAKYTPPGENQTLNPEIPENKEAMQQIGAKMDSLEDATAASSVPVEAESGKKNTAKPSSGKTTKNASTQAVANFDQVCEFGPRMGEKFSEVPDKFLGWMLASIDTKQNLGEYKPTKEYTENLRLIVFGDEKIRKIYDSYIKKKAS